VITRRGALALALAGVAAHPVRALAADSDSGPLSALAAYQHAVISAYDAVIPAASGGDERTLRKLRTRAAGVAGELPKPPPAAPAPADATLDQLIALEEALIANCYTGLENVSEERHLKGVAAFMADAGRRVVVLRDLAGQPLLPRAFETGEA
jgi:hypothetical protein